MSDPRSPDLLTSLLLAFTDFAEPVLNAFDGPDAMEFFWYERGWRVTLDDAVLAMLGQVLPVADAAPQLRQLTDTIRAEIETGTAPSPDDVGLLAEVVSRVVRALGDLGPPAPGSAGLPAPLDDPATWEALAEDLFDSLLEPFLRLHHPVVYVVLLAGGCLRYEHTPALPPWRVARIAPRFDWEQAARYTDDPGAALAGAYHWDDPAVPFDHARLLDVLGRILDALHIDAEPIVPGIHVEPGLPDDVMAGLALDTDGLRATFLRGLMVRGHARYEVGFDLVPARTDPSSPPDGLLLRPRLIGAAAQTFPLGSRFELLASVATDLGSLLAVELFPGRPDMTGGAAAIGTAVEVHGTGQDPWYLLGTAGGSRIEVRSPSLRVSLEGTSDEAELRIRLGSGVVGGQDGARIVLDLAGADSFVQDGVSTGAIDVGFSPEVIWSSRTGLSVNGEPKPQVTLPARLSVGSFTLRDVRIALERTSIDGGGSSVRLRAGADLTGSIGPVDLVVQQLGFTLTALPYTRDQLRALAPSAPRPVLGNLGLDLDFAPPLGAGLTVDAAGVVTGGGFIAHDPAQGLYSGVLQLSFVDWISLGAIGLVSTKLPDGRPGWSMLVIITARDFEPIPLVLGFFLTGIGGLVGIHRTFDDAAMRAALKSGAAAAVLFPDDPVANAPAVLRTLGTLFPASRGSHLIGVLLRIERNVPPVTLDLAVVYEFGTRHRLMVLGRITSLMPTPEDDLVHLRLDAEGVVDLDQGTIAIDAALVDSTIAHVYALSGAMALRARLTRGAGAAFVLAIGGFNPHFTPPPGVPALDRVAIALSSGSNPRFVCQAYVALTSNTLQFGADASLHAAAYGFSIDGDVGFDVLIQRDPFGFIADFHASVQLKHGSTNLFSVKVKGELQGPRPLRVSGVASFEICWCDFDIRFDKTLIDGEPPQLPSVGDVLGLLEDALRDVHSWVSRSSASAPVGVRSRSGAPGVLLDPHGTVQLTQQVVPLATARDLDLFSGAALTGDRRFTLGVTVSGATQQVSPVPGQFAPASFFTMSDEEKLAAPSFEQMTAGFELGSQAWSLDDGLLAVDDLAFDTFVLGTDPAPASAGGAPFRPEASFVVGVLATFAASTSVTPAPAPPPPAVRLRTPAWQVVSTTDDAMPDGEAATGTWHEARARLRDLQGRATPVSAAAQDAPAWQLAAVWTGA
jgi:hypothetical protein